MKGLSKKFLIMGGGLFIILLIVYTVMRNNKEMFKNKLTKTKKRPKSCPPSMNFRNGKCYGDYEYKSPCNLELYNSPQIGNIIYNCNYPMKCVGNGFCGYNANNYIPSTNSWMPEQEAYAGYLSNSYLDSINKNK
jgi:hypothetical protein